MHYLSVLIGTFLKKWLKVHTCDIDSYHDVSTISYNCDRLSSVSLGNIWWSLVWHDVPLVKLVLESKTRHLSRHKKSMVAQSSNFL